ncbi:hypothetical protein [Pseudarthrobacter sp. CCNWLW217]|uniref:hypothetical protein n=1 Tax=Pseudarthrobacter sp. CCNWLW217 TaxID=3127469 RepID=UPI0030780619
MVTLVEGLALAKLALTVAALARKVRTAAAEVGASVSFSTVRSIVSKLDLGMTVLAHQGAARYRDA